MAVARLHKIENVRALENFANRTLDERAIIGDEHSKRHWSLRGSTDDPSVWVPFLMTAAAGSLPERVSTIAAASCGNKSETSGGCPGKYRGYGSMMPCRMA